MPDSDDLGQLQTTEWDLLEKKADEVEEACRRDGFADLARHLPPPGMPLRPLYLFELIKTEMMCRWEVHGGKGATLEDYLRRYPELGEARTLPVKLIYEECRARYLHGDRPPLDTYRQRFPNQFDELRRLVRQDRELRRLLDSSLSHPDGGTLQPDPGTLNPESATRPESPPLAQTRIDPPPTKPPTAPPATPSNLTPGFVSPLTRAIPPSPKGADASQILIAGEGFRLQSPRLGAGQFGEVYRAEAPGGVEVAVKRIFRTLDDEASQRELQALQLLKRLQHPFLLNTHSFWPMEDRLIIVMELAEGSLKDRFKECKNQGLAGIPPEELIGYFRDAAEALDYLHNHDVVHRDIKPENILRLKGHAKVADFGLARLQENNLATATFCGTPLYMAPEVWKGKNSVHSDQYSLAVTYVEMRLGRPVFRGSYHEVALMHEKDKPNLDPLPEAEQNVLLKALAKNPAERYPTCKAFIRAMEEALAPPPPPPPPPPTFRWYRVASLVLLVALALMGWALWQYLTRVDWLPKDWKPVGSETAYDLQGKKYYTRLYREINGIRVEVVLVKQERSTDPPTFYAMEHKVWNELFAQFMNDPNARRELDAYAKRRPATVKGEWKKGGHAPGTDQKELGVEGKQGRVPVMRATVTEAHFFAVWLGGKLPNKRQWLKAAGALDCEDIREGPYDGNPKGPGEIAVNCWKEGPWSIDRDSPDKSIHGCRGMGSNGKEWTRSLPESPDGREEVPVEMPTSDSKVVIVGKSYLADDPLTFNDMKGNSQEYLKPDPEIGFRIVLEQD